MARGITIVDYFGRTMVANLPEKIRIGIVKCSVSGTKIELWDKDAFRNYLTNLPAFRLLENSRRQRLQHNPYQYLVDLAKIAQKDGVIKGILIHQGESNFEDQDWPKKMKKIYDDFMKDLDLNPRTSRCSPAKWSMPITRARRPPSTKSSRNCPKPFPIPTPFPRRACPAIRTTCISPPKASGNLAGATRKSCLR